MKTNPAKIPVEVDNFLDCGLSNDSRFIERKFGHEVKFIICGKTRPWLKIILV